MRLLHITATHMNTNGGIPIVLKRLIEEQNKIENVTSRLLVLKSGEFQINSEYFDYLIENNLKKYIIEYNPDIVILHSFYHIEYIYVYILLNQLKKKYYIQPHGSFVKKSFKKSFFKKKIANMTIFKKLIKNSWGYIYLSKSEYDSSLYHKAHDIIIPNGVDRIESNGLISEDRYIHFYYIGRYDIKEKGIDVLKCALEKLDSIEESIVFDFYGSGNVNQIDFVNKINKNLKNIKVINHGPIYGDDKNRELKNKGINVLLSKHEGMPMTILEGWAFGNPCIVTMESNVSEFIKECPSIGRIVKSQPDAVANVMKKVIKDYKNNHYEIRNECLDYVEKNFGWNSIAKKSILLLKNNI